jgi:hypothetical protein
MVYFFPADAASGAAGVAGVAGVAGSAISAGVFAGCYPSGFMCFLPPAFCAFAKNRPEVPARIKKVNVRICAGSKRFCAVWEFVRREKIMRLYFVKLMIIFVIIDYHRSGDGRGSGGRGLAWRRFAVVICDSLRQRFAAVVTSRL